MIKNLLLYLSQKDLFSLFLITILIILGNLLEILSIGTIPIFLKLALDPSDVIEKAPDFTHELINKLDFNQNNFLIIFSIILMIVFILKNLYLFGIHYYQKKFFKDLRIRNSDKLLNFYFSQPYSFFLSNNPAYMLRSLSSDLDLANSYIESILNVLREFLIVLFIFVLLLLVNTVVSLSVLFGIIFFSSITFLSFKKKLSSLAKANFEERGKQIKIVDQIFGNIQEIKILLKEKFFFDKFKMNIIQLKYNDFFHQLFTKAPRLIFELLAVFTIVSIIIFYILDNREIANLLPLLALFGMCAIRLIPSFNNIIQSFAVIKKSKISFKSIVREMNKTRYNFSQIKYNENLKDKHFNIDNIQIQNLSFKYKDTDKFVLKNINIKIKKNSSIGIIGKTGCGKSTLIKIILGLLEPTSGKVLFNDTNINENLRLWFKNLSYVPQKVYLSDESIKKNIAIGEDEDMINFKKISYSVKLAGLDEFISSLPKKLDTQVGAQGIKLSGGQIQRIGIARAIYTDPSIFVLDEATSSLDQKTENKILSDFFKFKDSKFTIIVSHRLSSLKFCDEVFYIKDGEIKDFGKIDDLIFRNKETLK
tara:strand:+ start:373 stop:2145 length:1773 start_codon:yes stop_codon:yes gene_type:complete